jgi:hypothetical protein
MIPVRKPTTDVDAFIAGEIARVAVAEARDRSRQQHEMRCLRIIDDMVTEAEMGDPTRMIAAAESETTIACLVAALRGARNVIPLDAGSPIIMDIDAAIRRAEGL